LLSACGMSLFAGWVIGATFIPNMADKYGRKPLFMAGFLI